MTMKLTPDAPAPGLSVETVGASRWELAAQTPRNFTMLVFYRGYHCPVCKGYLNSLNDLAEGFAEAGVETIALSMDGEDRARLAREEWGVDKTPIGYGLTEATARSWELYLSRSIKEAETALFCEPALFLARPDGRLYFINIGNMPWSRPDLGVLLSKIPFIVENNYPARGDA